MVRYKLDEGRGRVAHDAGRRKAGGKIVSARWGKMGDKAALEFNGESSYVNCGPGAKLGLTKQFTLCAWVLPTGQPKGEAILVGEAPRYYGMTYYKEHVYLYVAGGGNSVRAPAPPDRLYHVAGAFDGKTLSLYLNGKLKASTQVDGIRSIPAKIDLAIGGGSGGFFKGLIRDVRVYDHALIQDEVLAIVAEGLHDEMLKMRAATEKLYDNVYRWKPTAQNIDFLKDLAMVRWGASSSGNMDEFNTPALTVKRAAELKRMGGTAAFINGRQNRLNHIHIEDELATFLQRVSKACHDRGMRAFDHLDFTIFWQQAYPILFKHPDWAQRSLWDGTPMRWCCPNNPSYREYYAQYLEKLVRAGIDGFMLDEINFRIKRYCGCEHCRAKFERETGYRFPEYGDETVIANGENPLWRLWQEWQKKSLVEFKGFLLERVHAINPDAIIFAYSTAIYRISVRMLDMMENGRVCFIGTEGTDTVYPGAYNFFAQMRILSSMARLYGRPANGHFATNNPVEAVFGGVFLASLTGVRPWRWEEDKLTWRHLREATVAAEPLADVGILLSPSTRDGTKDAGIMHSAETFAWCGVLGMTGIQFEPLPGLYTRPEDLDKYRAVIIPYCESMPARLVDDVDAYVRKGGVAVVVGLAGRYDRLSFPLGKRALFRRMGMKGISMLDKVTFDPPEHVYARGTGGKFLRIAAKHLPELPRTIELPAVCRFKAVMRPGIRAEVLARFDDGMPAITSIPRGKGRYIHMGFLPGSVIYQPRMYKRYKWRKYFHAPSVAMMRAVAREATGGRDRIEVEGDGLLTTTYQKEGRIWVRMVNVAGLRSLPVGKKIGNVIPTYPKLDTVRIHVRMPVEGTVKLFTPDREQEVVLKVAQTADGAVVTIPAGTFKRYAFVRVEARR